MGSKAALLRGALGAMISKEAQNSDRFVDLFSGSGSVSHFVSENSDRPVLSGDLQVYSSFLAGAVIKRTSPLVNSYAVEEWTKDVNEALGGSSVFASLHEPVHRLGKATVLRARKNATTVAGSAFITRHYGGHYFSPQQAYALDMLYERLPSDSAQYDVCMAALLHTASGCAAAPGHTAQPFQPTKKLLPFIRGAWEKDALAECQRHVSSLAVRYAQTSGETFVGDAMDLIGRLGPGDLVFCDPPYSDAQYSRFYHVLEGIARGGWVDVLGAGRSPHGRFRSSSSFSLKSQATKAIADLLSGLRERSCRVMVTFPDADASNGLSSNEIIAIASHNWTVQALYVDSTHSTLGGSTAVGSRGARRSLKEAVLLLEPR